MRRVLILYIASMMILGVTFAAKQLVSQRPVDSLEAPLASIPERIGEWQLEEDLSVSGRIRAVIRPTDLLARRYQYNGNDLDLFIAYYSQQRSGESMHSPKNCMPGGGWEIWKLGSTQIPFNGSPTDVNQFSIQNAGNRMVMIYWYQSRQRVIASEYSAKILLLQDALLDGRTAGSLVRIIVPDHPSAVAAAIEFSRLIMPEVQRCIGKS